MLAGDSPAGIPILVCLLFALVRACSAPSLTPNREQGEPKYLNYESVEGRLPTTSAEPFLFEPTIEGIG